jgi:hypothetical protein
MNKHQFWTLNVTSIILAVLLISHSFFVRHTNQLSERLAREQAAIETGRQNAAVLDQLAQRIAKGSEADRRLTNILSGHGLKVTLTSVDGQKKNYP